ncbi:MAG: alpha/beta hydrolase [Myxococcota bacterium]
MTPPKTQTSTTEMWIPKETDLYLYTLSRGHGVPLVFCNGLGVAAESFWPAICSPLAPYVRMIHWDYRGHGRSSLPSSEQPISFQLCVEDLFAVLDHYQLDQAIIVGHSMGVQLALEAFRQQPQRVLGLISILGTFQYPFDTFLRSKYAARVFDVVSTKALRHPKPLGEVWTTIFQTWLTEPIARFFNIVHPKHFPTDEFRMYIDHMRKMSPRVFFQLARSLQEHSADDILSLVNVPTLIFSGEKDFFTPPENAHYMAHRIPNAELQHIKDGSHAAMVEHPDLFWLRILHFLQKHFKGEVPQAPSQAQTSTTSIPLEQSSIAVQVTPTQRRTPPQPSPESKTTKTQCSRPKSASSRPKSSSSRPKSASSRPKSNSSLHPPVVEK